MPIQLGFSPDRLNIQLSRFSDFVAALIYDGGVWPDGTVIELRFYPTNSATSAAVTWPATITAERADWHVDNLVVASDVLDARNDIARLFYDDGAGTELEWALGSVRDTK